MICWVSVTPDSNQVGKNQALNLHKHCSVLFNKVEGLLNVRKQRNPSWPTPKEPDFSKYSEYLRNRLFKVSPLQICKLFDCLIVPDFWAVFSASFYLRSVTKFRISPKNTASVAGNTPFLPSCDGIHPHIFHFLFLKKKKKFCRAYVKQKQLKSE